MELAQIILEYIKVLIWPLTTVLILLVFREEFSQLFRRAKKVNLPGGISLETFEEKVDEAKELAKEVETKREPKVQDAIRTLSKVNNTKANQRMISLGLQPSPSGLDIEYYKNMAQSDQRLALAGLRIDFEMMLRNLGKGFQIEITKRDSISAIVTKLHDKGAITSEQRRLMIIVFELANYAIHGEEVSYEKTVEVLDIGKTLIDDYRAWLEWGFSEG